VGVRKKAFDCVEMQHRGAEKTRRLTAGMTPEEELAFWSRGTEKLLALQRAMRDGEPGVRRRKRQSSRRVVAAGRH
jgi:hypothetical protein